MKTAKEMFEELGYDYFNNGLRITCQIFKGYSKRGGINGNKM